MNNNYKLCTRCVMDNRSDHTIKFLRDGTCNYCNEALTRMKYEYFPDSKGKHLLDEIMSKIKHEGKCKQYDCMVGVSGGVDSSYVIYLGYQYGLRMLAVHIDDGLDNDIAVTNIKNLCDKANTDIIMVKPDLVQYKDLTRSLFLARVPNLAMVQDNLFVATLNDTAKEHNIKYNLSGINFSHECILERSVNEINGFDKKHIMTIHKQFGRGSIGNLRLIKFYEAYIYNRYFNKTKKILPLNFIDYNLDKAVAELAEFCDYHYCGGKHYESILTRFLQCYYLPVKYQYDKRRSHYSSLIVSGQMTRHEAVEMLSKDLYIDEELREYDFDYLANFIGMTRNEFNQLMNMPAKHHQDYPHSAINDYAALARKFRRFLG